MIFRRADAQRRSTAHALGVPRCLEWEASAARFRARGTSWTGRTAREGEEKKVDSNTQQKAPHGISRRSFLVGAAGMAVGASALGLNGCSASADDKVEYGVSSDGAATLSFLVKPAPITDDQIAQTKDFDVVIVGAGTSGVPAALAAAQAGASVGVLQKESMATGQGNYGSGINLETSDPAAVEAMVSAYVKANDHRTNRKLLEVWAKNSGVAVPWVMENAIPNLEDGVKFVDLGNATQRDSMVFNEYGPINYYTSFCGPKPNNVGHGMRALEKTAVAAGVSFFYKTPAVQLVVGESGAITGVIGQDGSGQYVKLNAKKGVILATGDYQNNQAMCDYFIPEAKYFVRKQSNKTGDGHIMGYWAGAVIEPIGHTKMAHDMDAGPISMMDVPYFLHVNQEGNRYADESIPMAYQCNYLSQAENTGWYSQVFDANYMTAVPQPGMVPPEKLRPYMPEDTTADRTGVLKDFIGTYSADTLEELAAKLEIDPATFVATVERYNELCAGGKDLDLGKAAKYMIPITTAPFYAIHRHVRLSAVFGGLVVDENSQCLNADGQPIKGLFAIGNTAGGYYGGADGQLVLGGASVGRCYTFGYVVGGYVASL